MASQALLPSYGASATLDPYLEKPAQDGSHEAIQLRDCKNGGEVFLSYHDVTYELDTGCCGRGEKKVILNSVSGYMPRGVNAVMGPTGSGKTSLLDILADRKGKRGIGGMVLINGERPDNFKCMSGYVVQDDMVMGTLTVRENLHFSAALRLPSNMSWRQRKDRVEKVIDELGLHLCANTKIGTKFFRGVSGGECQRTKIGMELLIEPQFLFLDEPTTGLDANTAMSVVRLLKQLTERKDQVVIMSIHQPRYSIFELFDSITLLSLGHEVYHGPAKQALEYFDNLGFRCDKHENPADFILDTLINCEHKDIQSSANIDDDTDDEVSAPLVQPLNLAACYQQSKPRSQVAEKLQTLIDTLQEKKQSKWWRRRKAVYATGFVWQSLVISLRTIVNLARSPEAYITQFIVMMLLALIAGGIYYRLDKKELTLQTVISDRIGALYFLTFTQLFGTASAVELFMKQKPLFIHENSNGFYRISTFYLAKVVTDIIPNRIFPLVPFCCIIYFMIGFQLEVSKFFILFLTLSLTSIAETALIFAISTPLTIAVVANIIGTLAYVIQLLLAGFLISLSSLPVYLRWLKYLSIFHYSIEALAINEIVGQSYNISDGTAYDEGVVIVNGTQALIERGFETSTAWLWYDQICLAAICLLLLTITYVNLRLFNKK